MTVDELLNKQEELEEVLETCDWDDIDDINAELNIVEAELEFRRASGEE